MSISFSKTASEAPYPTVSIRPDRLKSILAGHPWIFSGALEKKPEAPDGGLVRIVSGTRFLGIGYYNSRTDIAVRILTRSEEAIDAGFFSRRFAAIRARKEAWLPERTNAYRLVFGEADGLPGLIVDRYDRALVVQFHTFGMDLLRPQVTAALLETLAPEVLLERSDLAVRRMEGLDSQPVGFLHGPETSEVEIEEQGFRFRVNILEGQKTGFFLDQRENRAAILRFCRDRKVLNCFSYTGGFSVYAASVARRVASVDISKPAMETCRRNFALNNFSAEDSDFVAADVFDYLKALQPGAFDAIILDPPSFAKNRKQLVGAIRAYTSLNTLALEKLPEGGILVSSSCTSHVDSSTFIKILHQSGVNARCTLRVLDSREQPFDHPYHLSFPEGRYLKFFVLQKAGIG